LPPRAAENRPLEAFAFEAVLVPYALRPDWPDWPDWPDGPLVGRRGGDLLDPEP
jgi:hypothetical protein